jgi:hypothetical protein
MRSELSPTTLVNVVAAIEEAKRRIFIDGVTFFSKNDIWLYIEIGDQKLCNRCRFNAQHQPFTGDYLRALFPYLEILDANTIAVNEHPNCRCVMVRQNRVILHEN